MFELSQRSDYAAWERRIEPLSRRLVSLERELYRHVNDAGLTLTQAHHAELKKLAPDDTPGLRAIGFDVLSYPRMDGSTSTQPLAALIACRSLGVSYDWVGRTQRWPRFFGGDPPGRREAEAELLEFTLRAIAKKPADERLASIINSLLAANASTHDAYVNLIEGKSEIGLLARPPSAAELQLARSKGVELDLARIALDAFVLLVNSENPVNNLSTAQIRDIYLHRVIDWQSVGGSAGNIVAFHRQEDSGSEELMRTLVMTGTNFRTPPHGRQIAEGGMIGLFLALTGEKLGIGYSVYYYEQFMSGSPRTKVIAVDGIEPTYETIRNRKYPYTCEVLVVTRKRLDENAPARRLRDWLRSSEGQSVVRESGYVPNTSRER